MKKEFHMEINGFSNYLTGMQEKCVLENLTVSLSFTPYTYESGISGVFSVFDEEQKAGLRIGAGKQGRLTAEIGTGHEVLKIQSKIRHLDYQKPNCVTLAFWGTAGWCDLCINGELSERIQFPRHRMIVIPKGRWYIGRYAGQKEDPAPCGHGVFHGKLYEIRWEKRYLPYREVLEKQKQVSYPEEKIMLYRNCEVQNDRYRPVYHLMPPAKWMNEPHAPFYYNGHYHLFYQSNPHAPVWDNLCWGHLVSTDLVRWKDAGIALNPDSPGPDYDRDGCWSGSAFLDESQKPVIFYTAGNNGFLPNQSVAMARPEDPEDPVLTEWKKEGVLLRQGQGEGFLGEFRDPFAFRKEGMWHLLVGTGDCENGGGNALVYTGNCLESMECRGFLMEYDFADSPEVGHVWELPVLLPLRDEMGRHVQDIFLFCSCQVEEAAVETYYYLGHYDQKRGKFHTCQKKPGLLDLGHGTFTGPSGFTAPDGRSILFTIAQGKRGSEQECRSGWAHNGGLPVELSLKDSRLQILPVRELEKYFEQVLEAELSEGERFAEATGKYSLLEHKIEIVAHASAVQMELSFETDSWMITYDKKSRRFQAESRSSGTPFSIWRGEEDSVEIGEEPIRIQGYFDHSMVEFYLNGRKSMTLRNYSYKSGYSFDLKTDGETKVKIWRYCEKGLSGEMDGQSETE